ncbi:hypothetical protein KHP62_10350 [Rhodobacteraceae bacterium NNCM2]|nr:hypothetical protein [Coraliihabitans acroporae]
MSVVIAMSRYKETPGHPAGAGGGLTSPFGFRVPADAVGEAAFLTPTVIAEIRSGGGLGNPVRVLRRMAFGGRRALFLDAGIGILPAVAAQRGAARVIAFERDNARAALMQRIFEANDLNAEAIFGRVVARLAQSGSRDTGAETPPEFDLGLILAEERIDTVVAVSGLTEPKLLRNLPASVGQVLLGGGRSDDCSPARDLMIASLIGTGFSFDPVATEGDAVCFRRAVQASSRVAG